MPRNRRSGSEPGEEIAVGAVGAHFVFACEQSLQLGLLDGLGGGAGHDAAANLDLTPHILVGIALQGLLHGGFPAPLLTEFLQRGDVLEIGVPDLAHGSREFLVPTGDGDDAQDLGKVRVARVAHEKPASVARKEPETVPTASVFTPADTPSPKDTVKSAEAGGPLPKFRWPANGRVITGFGPMTNGQKNDGINIALPENTPVKAAEEGVVAYAGNELKGYGNLVLVRHPTGYVTAYAHAKELLVKRGDQVKRGQVIARSGQTGNVNAPQLHFEIRKGASPLDPLKFLGG